MRGSQTEVIMRAARIGMFLVVFALPIFAQEYERFLLPVSPAVNYCGYDSQYETRLLLFNDSDAAVAPVCFAADCTPIDGRRGRTVTGGPAMVPLPSYLYVPKDAADHVSATLVVESRQRGGADTFFTEVPVIRESDFRDRIELLGIRTDEGYRQTMRIFGRDSDAGSSVRVMIYDLDTGELLYEMPHTLYVFPIDPSARMSSSPSFSMECNLTDISRRLRGRQLRLVLVPEEGHPKIWAFVSVTSNETQHFYNVLPR
jgi:hypothetical protein